jgi:DNA-binding response OmpR family regulator
MKLLIADDEADIAEVIAFAARMSWPGCEVIQAASGSEALARFAEAAPDLVILDVSMPSPDGFEVCRQIRESSNVPILMLTVRRNTLDKVRALDLGADDYLVKPFDHLELLARLRALLRRAHSEPAAPEPDFASGELTIDFTTHEVKLRGEVVRLTHTEYRLLAELARHAGTVMPHQLLLDRVWGSAWVADPSYLKVFIRRLRQKLGDAADNPRYIQTEWGVGYRFIPTSPPMPN